MIDHTQAEAIDALSDAMVDVHDMDTGFTDYARAAVKWLVEHGAVFAREPDAPCSCCGKPSTTVTCHMGGCPLGADL